MTRNIVVNTLSRPVTQREVEMCEHKGIGHPDTVTDGVCESASREFSLACLKAYGHVLHHNLDKGLLVAGKSIPRFGGGEIITPIKLIICGRATSLDDETDVHRIATSAARRYLEKNIRCDPGIFDIQTEIRESSASLQALFLRQDSVPLANDTSFGAGFAPYSALEQSVLELSRTLKSSGFRQLFPAAGDDFKIMGCNVSGKAEFTLALAFVDKHVEGVEHYFLIKRTIQEYLADLLNKEPDDVRLNTLDDSNANDESGLYLTVSGLSAEMGDDGQVGRGNRVNGLITPGRMMSLEAAAGKNPVSHVGKIYNVLAMLIARDIYEDIEEVDEVRVQLLSSIGEPIDQPQIASLELVTGSGATAQLNAKAKAIADKWFSDIGEIKRLILDEKVSLY